MAAARGAEVELSAAQGWALSWSIQRAALLEGQGPALALRWEVWPAAAPANGSSSIVARCTLQDPAVGAHNHTHLLAAAPGLLTLHGKLLHIEVPGELVAVVRYRGAGDGTGDVADAAANLPQTLAEPLLELLYARTSRLWSLGVGGGLAEPPELTLIQRGAELPTRARM